MEASNAPSKMYNWAQTDSHVVVNVLIKNLTEKDVTIRLTPHVVDVAILLSDSSQLKLHFDLFSETIDKESSWKVTPDNLEIMLKKKEVKEWPNLEKIPENSKAASKKGPKNWDKIVQEFEETEPEEKDINSVFKEIYDKGSEEVRRAMNKSFQESGGTVLSTNWKEVAKEKVEVKPPEGVEYKSWDP